MRQTDIEEMFCALGAVAVRRMFGGRGVYHQGLIIAVELRGELMLKGDDVSAPQFEAAGARRWTYQGRHGRPILMPYWTVPAEAFDEPEAMARWAGLAYAAALRAQEKSTRRALQLGAER